MARILIVEDDGALRLDLAGRLQEWGHEVRQAQDGLQGVDVVETWHPDLILSDVNMPRCSGIEFAEHISAHGSPWAGVSFFFISSATSRSNVLEGLESGADDYLSKPIDYEMLKTKIEVNLERKEAFLTEERMGRLAVRMNDSMLNGLAFAGATGAALVAVIFLAYWFKTALGIDFFRDVHFPDFFLG